MRVPPGERGTALLTVLLLVAVMATVAATALDRIGLATRLTANSAGLVQARAWLGTAEQLAATRLEDLLNADQAQTLGAGWMGVERSIDLPDGTVVTATIEDGGNCFNLNSLVQEKTDGTLAERPAAREQFRNLMTLLGIGAGDADRIASSATDYIDSDTGPLPVGEEARAYDGDGLVPNRAMADASELRAVSGVTGRHYEMLRRWVCALPSHDLSPINVNTLLPEQAPLLAMLAPAVIDPVRARSQLSARPAGGYGSVLNFWNSGAMRGLEIPTEVTQQVQVRTGFFRMRARVTAGGTLAVQETALFDARQLPVRLVARSYGEAS